MTTPILGIYRRDAFNKTLRVGTPDPTKYHDAREVRLEGANEAPVGAKMPPNSKFTLPGVIIPHAKRGGGSMGWNSEAPMKVFIDPEQTGGRIQVDIGDLRRNSEAFSQLSKDVQNEDDIVEIFARYSNLHVETKQRERPMAEPVMAEVREAPLQMRGSYVAPKATSGGGQVKPASFGKKAQFPEVQPAPRQALPEMAMNSARSLHEELAGPTISLGSTTSRTMKKVTFELPMIGQQNSSLGQFPCFYHDVIREDVNLVLVYDHSHPSQMVWFPPALEDPNTGEPLGIAVLVHGSMGEADVLYRAFPTGVRFKYRNEEFCLLTVDKEKQMGGKP
jgi:hypothetical protein